MYSNGAYNIYAQNNVGVESPAKLIAMMYEGVLRFNVQARKAIDEGNIEKRVYWTNRSIAVIAELIATLDKSQGDIAGYLEGLYTYQIQLLSTAGIDNDVSKIDEVSNVFKELSIAWRETADVAY